MTILVCFRDPAPAQTLVDYLVSQKIECIIKVSKVTNTPTPNLTSPPSASNEEAQYCIELADPEQRQQAAEILAHFIDAPHHPRYQAASWESSNVSKLPTAKIFENNGLGSALAHPFTSAIIVICIAVYLLMPFPASGMFIERQLFIAPLNELASTHHWWRLITPAFLHFSLMHIAFNLLWWWILGTQIEARMGRSSLLLLLLFTGILSNVGQLLVTGPNFGGLSGVVYGLLGFYWILGWLKPQWGFEINKGIIGFMLVWLILGYTDVFGMNTANTAHTVGLLSGMLSAWLLVQFAKR